MSNIIHSHMRIMLCMCALDFTSNTCTYHAKQCVHSTCGHPLWRLLHLPRSFMTHSGWKCKASSHMQFLYLLLVATMLPMSMCKYFHEPKASDNTVTACKSWHLPLQPGYSPPLMEHFDFKMGSPGKIEPWAMLISYNAMHHVPYFPAAPAVQLTS
jgi:hypothetical protein